MPSYYTPEIKAIGEASFILEGSEFHHLANVRRSAVGDEVSLNNGKGLLIKARIASIGKKQAELVFLEEIKVNPVRKYAIAFSLLKSQHDELIVEKCTELGAYALFPFVSDTSVRKPSDNTRERFIKTALSAIKQCDNPWLPEVSETLTLKNQLDAIRAEGYQPVICSERRPDIWLDSLDEALPPCFVIGPEGGWSNSEYTIFSSLPVSEITLSPLIARAETAAIAVASQWVFWASRSFSSR